jgi:hypothetical protein
MIDIYTAMPMHLQFHCKLVEDSTLVEKLEGSYLDYATARSLLEDCIVFLEFSGAGLERVCKGNKGDILSNSSLYSPSKNDDAGNPIVDADLLQKRQEELRSIIKEKFGDSIEVPQIQQQ